MTRIAQVTILFTMLAVGCQSAPKVNSFSAGGMTANVEKSAEQLAQYSEDAGDDEPIVDLPEPVEQAEPIPPLAVEPLSEDGLSVETLEQMALANNPVVGQAAARVRSLRGKYVQVGLPPNPSFGYVASEVGNEGTAGQQGGFAGQDFITGHKLQKNRAVVAAEIDKAEQILAATQRRVQTDVRVNFYRALVAQQRLELAKTLVNLNGEAVKASQDLLDAEEIPTAGLLQTEVELQNAEIVLRTSQNELTAAWQQLSAVVGDLDLPPQKLVGDAGALPNSLDWDETLTRVTTMSPEMATAMAELSRSRRALARAYAEPIPDISTQFMVQYDNSTDDTIAGIQAGIPLPLWNKNQGGIRQAQAEISVASQNIDRVALNLKNRLAITYQEFASARTQAETYKTEILPRAQRTYDLVRQGYTQGEAGYLDLLTAQRTYAQTNLAYLEALDALWQSHVKIDGLLLSESLSTSIE